VSSDQWGQPQPDGYGYGQQPGPIPGQPPLQPPQPGGPQGPYAAPQGQYGQQPGPDSFGQAPMQPPQGPYGQAPQPGPYGPPQPPGPYGQPADPFGQQPITPQNPYGQPQPPYGQQPGAPGQFPGQQQPYGYPGQPGMPGQQGQGGNKRNLIVGGAVLVVIIAAAAIFFAVKGSGSSGGTKTQAESCTSWKTELTTMGGQNPQTVSDYVGVLNTDVPVMQNIANDAQSGTFKTQMTKVAADFGSFRNYLQANPNTDPSSDSPPAPLQSLESALTTDVTAVDGTCGITDSSGSGGL
jgi:hypothetical protein